ncbi:hypothetical protein [Streptomyces sp. NPDC087212]|uniref:hypothetical protein n=1 Tax=Streptomyces sp. NPDC087212 TaxID=3365766 RepID=UPI003814B430
MSTAFVPHQPTAPAPTGATPPHASEATRLLCAGTYLDVGYRDRVIEELHLNEERIVAPSLGFDAARVLAHALRARRLELRWAAAVVALWLAGLLVTGGLFAAYLVPGLLLGLARRVRGTAARPPVHRWYPALQLRWTAWLLMSFFLVGNLVAAFGAFGSLGDVAVGAWQAWFSLLALALVAVCGYAQSDQLHQALAAELSPQRFPDAANDPAELTVGPRVQRLSRRIRLEQHAPLIMYNEAHPFCGAGFTYDTWVLAVELKPDGEKGEEGPPISNRVVLEKVRALVEQLRATTSAGSGARDRLRWLEIDECVFLPVEGLLTRDQAPYQDFEEHRARAVEEGAEKRRHFLRIRVGGWDEELVVTVFVRIHTQGRMLMLEIAPHVLAPVRAEFRDADRTAHRFRHNSTFGKTVAALALVPASAFRSLGLLARGAGHRGRALTGGHPGALPEGPGLSVRELATDGTLSRFQAMDIDRYLKTVQDRVAGGVRAALAACGYETGEFVQKIVNISNGDVNIGTVEGSTFAVGTGASATSVSDKQGGDSHGR